MVGLYVDAFDHYRDHVKGAWPRVASDFFTQPRKATMTTFIDKRAAALGITGELSNADRIALDHNSQLEKTANAVKAAADAFAAGQVGIREVLDKLSEMTPTA